MKEKWKERKTARKEWKQRSLRVSDQKLFETMRNEKREEEKREQAKEEEWLIPSKLTNYRPPEPRLLKLPGGSLHRLDSHFPWTGNPDNGETSCSVELVARDPSVVPRYPLTGRACQQVVLMKWSAPASSIVAYALHAAPPKLARCAGAI